MDISTIHLEVWQVVLICILMLPVFFAANYLVVVYAVNKRKHREEMMERAVAAIVARDMKPENRFKKKPRRRF